MKPHYPGATYDLTQQNMNWLIEQLEHWKNSFEDIQGQCSSLEVEKDELQEQIHWLESALTEYGQ